MPKNRKTGKGKRPVRERGRPRKGDSPFVSWQEVDKLLVFGENVIDKAGGHEDVRYPSFMEIAKRFSVSKSLIGQFASKHNCLKRRKESSAREQIQFEQELIKKRAKSRALTTEDELRIIDEYIQGFEKAVKEGRVRYDNPGDFNTMVRLKELKLGRADSRQEMHNLISLEEIQARHKALQARLAGQDPALTGRVDDEAPRRETGEAVDEKADDAADGDGGNDADVQAAASFRVHPKAEAEDEENEDN